jgi:hypothetical protein
MKSYLTRPDKEIIGASEVYLRMRQKTIVPIDNTTYLQSRNWAVVQAQVRNRIVKPKECCLAFTSAPRSLSNTHMGLSFGSSVEMILGKLTAVDLREAD